MIIGSVPPGSQTAQQLVTINLNETVEGSKDHFYEVLQEGDVEKTKDFLNKNRGLVLKHFTDRNPFEIVRVTTTDTYGKTEELINNQFLCTLEIIKAWPESAKIKSSYGYTILHNRLL